MKTFYTNLRGKLSEEFTAQWDKGEKEEKE